MQENVEIITSIIPSFTELDQTPDDRNRTIVEVPETSEKPIITDHEEDDEDDFEFTFDHESDWFSSNEVFPIFDRKLLTESDAIAIENDQLQTVRSALKKLFIVNNQNTNNQTDEDEDTDLNRLTPDTYCVWTPGNSPQASPARCEKSSSTGTTTTMIAKRWGINLKEMLIRRSKSDGKKSLVRFVSLKKKTKKSSVKKSNDDTATAEDVCKNKAVGGGREVKRRTTYLPYKKAIIGFGFYPSVNGFGGVNRNRPPF